MFLNTFSKQALSSPTKRAVIEKLWIKIAFSAPLCSCKFRSLPPTQPQLRTAAATATLNGELLFLLLIFCRHLLIFWNSKLMLFELHNFWDFKCFLDGKCDAEEFISLDQKRHRCTVKFNLHLHRGGARHFRA